MSAIPNKLTLLHNPGAGDESHGKEHLIRSLQEAGYEVVYQSIRKIGWRRSLKDAEAVVVAGGDGTVRKAVKALLDCCADAIPPMAVLPLGTANNIANALYGTESHDEIIRSWRSDGAAPFDTCSVKGVRDSSFFIEALGFGVFPALMQVMKQVDKTFSEQPRLRLDIALGILMGIVRNFKPARFGIEIDGADHSGEYLLVEVMNICSFGPNLRLHRSCEWGDGHFDVVMIPESGRQQLMDYLIARLSGEEAPADFPAVRGKQIRLTVDARRIHADDKLTRFDGAVAEIALEPGKLRFLGARDRN